MTYPFTSCAPEPAPDLAARVLAAAARRRADDWRQAALAVRHAADAVDQLVGEVAAFDRPDVWRGGVATAFHEELDRWRRRLAGDGVSVAVELRAAADRIEARAAGAEGASATEGPFGC